MSLVNDLRSGRYVAKQKQMTANPGSIMLQRAGHSIVALKSCQESYLEFIGSGLIYLNRLLGTECLQQ